MLTTLKKRIILSVAIAGFLCIAYGLTSWRGDALSQWSFKSKLRTAIELSFKGKIKSFDMRILTDFPWDGLFIFGPYTPASEIEKALGFTWPPAKKSGIELSDSICLLVFVHQGRVTRYYEYSRLDGDWSLLSSVTKLPPESALFSAKTQYGVAVVTLAAGNKN